ncbi:YqiA/YcfP family alpha/beta fold hydrolase [Bizionia paragorgiae]
MNILYLHGLMSSNQSVKIDWLKEKHTVFNPLLKYKESGQSIFADLEELIENNTIDLIIGSSMGGYLGFHLGNRYQIPTLLFNPALAKESEFKPEVKIVDNTSILHTLVLGQDDEVVIPSQTLQFLKANNTNFVYTFEPMGHRTSFDVFKKYFGLLK